jgi:hypothetical protein
MIDTTIKYVCYREKFIFDPFLNEESDLIRRTNKTKNEFYELMESYNAIINYEDYSCAVYFDKEEDIKNAIEFLQPIIDGYWVMYKLSREV